MSVTFHPENCACVLCTRATHPVEICPCAICHRVRQRMDPPEIANPIIYNATVIVIIIIITLALTFL